MLYNCQLTTSIEELRVIWMWALFFCFSFPEVLTFIHSVHMCLFRKRTAPAFHYFLTVVFFETAHSIGLSLFVFCVLPDMKNPVQGIMICHWACLVPCILGFLSEFTDSERQKIPLIIDVLVIIVQLIGSLSLVLIQLFTSVHNATDWKTWISTISLTLISFGLWKNYVDTNSSIG